MTPQDPCTTSTPLRWLSPSLAVAAQLGPEHMAEMARAGFQSVICNRPDFEYGPDQPEAAAVGQAAAAQGMRFAWLPVPPTGGSPEDARAMADLLAELPKPVLAYCRSGNRCIALCQNLLAQGRQIPE